MGSDPPGRQVFTFDTTHHALWAEQVAQERGIPAQVVPAPPEAGARCDLALEVLPEDVGRMGAALEEEGVSYRVWSRDGGSGTGNRD